jgi:serine/threonine protein kinase
MECANQSAAIDVFSLGGVFYFLLSNGLHPYFQSSYDNAVRDILQGKLPKLPDDADYRRYLNFSDKQIDFVIMRSKHPLFVALQDVMKKCWSFDPEYRPTSLEVVQMLEARLQKISQEE